MQISENLLHNQSQIEKYANLDAIEIKHKLSSCQPALNLLFIAGFAEINIDNNPRLVWCNTTENMINLQNIHQILSFDTQQKETYSILIAAEFTNEEAINTITQQEQKSDTDMMDLSIFESLSNNCFASIWSCSACTFTNTGNVTLCAMCESPITQQVPVNILSSCDHLRRILHSQKYYTMLKVQDNRDNADIFMSFCDYAYPQFLNDYQHVISTHEPHLEAINNEVISAKHIGHCNPSQCHLFRRYHADLLRQQPSSTNANNTDDTKFIFYCDLYDSIHNWLFHLYHTGMRCKHSLINGNDEEIQNQDQSFGRIVDEIRNKREPLLIKSERFIRDENTGNQCKFNLSTIKQQITGSDKLQNTFIDSLLEDIETEMEARCLQKLCMYLNVEKFDTDSINIDLMDRQSGSNIVNLMGDNAVYIADFIDESNCMISVLLFYCP